MFLGVKRKKEGRKERKKERERKRKKKAVAWLKTWEILGANNREETLL